jgi:acetoin utilization deacetylase AcuC-like enzyme
MKVFYRPEMVAFTDSYSPSSSKPRWVVEDWQNDPQINCEITGFEPATFSQLCEAHDPDFVAGVLDCRYENGFGNTDKAVADSLPYTSGSMLAAAEYAVLNRVVTASPTSGYHHAHYASAGSFCSFNALLITALVLKKKGLVNRVSIIDADRHYADGSTQIIKKLGLDWIEHHTQGQFFNSRSDCVNGRYTRWLKRAIGKCLGSDLVVYQAGVDSHVDDPLGGLQTTPELADRDRLVFEGLGHLPLVINLAGGYQIIKGATSPAEQLEPVLALHRQTARIATEVLGKQS